ncbi:hypothetical protein VQ056_21685 [Paenibacillus sp. JTLBN-2024]
MRGQTDQLLLSESLLGDLKQEIEPPAGRVPAGGPKPFVGTVRSWPGHPGFTAAQAA